MSPRLAYLMVILGAALWGVTGLFVQNLYTFEFTPWEVVGIRLIFSAIIIFFFLFFTKRSLLYIQFRDLPFFVGTGIISIAFFNFFFFTVMDEANLSLAVVLLYTGPVFVTLISRFTFGEPFSLNKISALIVMLAGCSLAVGLFPFGQSSVGISTILFGIASGFFYALYSIFGKYVSGRYNTLTITAYSMFFGALFLLPTRQLWNKTQLFSEPAVIFNGIGLAIFATVGAYALYTFGLTYVESSRAAILSTVEPVVAIFIGVAVFRDILSLWQTLGVVLVLVSVLLTVKTRKGSHPPRVT
ncbi:EamA family transporter [Salipaludibacillus neizhouensis]|uniref:EamA family transporter n=1 Tax=Salipaludibacillus neizhouensis TaxID=885475 RepID=A0A3A9K387_9BACI|nr:DMT family transporter [Salipaludibacillus neizhouensis]RKL66819.1 EamA family transporter [Salipaludibacillus neizhouensis]